MTSADFHVSKLSFYKNVARTSRLATAGSSFKRLELTTDILPPVAEILLPIRIYESKLRFSLFGFYKSEIVHLLHPYLVCGFKVRL